MARNGTDWVKVKLEYINSSMTMRELADKHNINAAGLMKRASREGWEAERQQKSAKVSNAAQSKLDVIRPNELAKLNEDSLKLSRALMAQAAHHIKTAQDKNAAIAPTELRQLATTISESQKIGRLALGVTTENTGVSNPDGSPIAHNVQAHSFTPEEYAQILKKALNEI